MIEILTAVDISASAARVWLALMDFAAYPRWNPVIRSIAGAARPGATLRVLFHPPGSLPLRFRAKVTVATAESEFRWTGSLPAARIFCGDHYFKHEPVATSYYLRMRVIDRPGVLADITRILADCSISIDASGDAGSAAERAMRG